MMTLTTLAVVNTVRERRALNSGDRWLATLCLLVCAGTHIPLVPEHLREATYIGIAFILLAAACTVLAAALVAIDTVAVWTSVAIVNGLALIAYMITRTIGLPLLADDVGNWLEPLSFPALGSELLALTVALSVLRRHHIPGSRESTLTPDGREGQG